MHWTAKIVVFVGLLLVAMGVLVLFSEPVEMRAPPKKAPVENTLLTKTEVFLPPQVVAIVESLRTTCLTEIRMEIMCGSFGTTARLLYPHDDWQRSIEFLASP